MVNRLYDASTMNMDQIMEIAYDVVDGSPYQIWQPVALHDDEGDREFDEFDEALYQGSFPRMYGNVWDAWDEKCQDHAGMFDSDRPLIWEGPQEDRVISGGGETMIPMRTLTSCAGNHTKRAHNIAGAENRILGHLVTGFLAWGDVKRVASPPRNTALMVVDVDTWEEVAGLTGMDTPFGDIGFMPLKGLKPGTAVCMARDAIVMYEHDLRQHEEEYSQVTVGMALDPAHVRVVSREERW